MSEARKILVVEDSFETRDSFTVLLELDGYDVIVANDGDEALAKALREVPDLVVTDVRMPHVNGIEMVRQLRKDPAFGSRVPILVVTGYAADYVEEAIAAGANHVLGKPVNPDELLALVASLLSKNHEA
jgi:CheY-like chemotaxis protein